MDIAKRRLSFNETCKVIAAVMSCLAVNYAYAEWICTTDTVLTEEGMKNYRYIERVNKREAFWHNLIPDMFSLQFAGGIGMLSAGLGWDYGSSSQWETHILVGFLPKRKYCHHYWTFTLREVYSPWKVRINDSYDIKPLCVSFSVNSIMHGDFWMSQPERYPAGYYGFSTRMRFHLGLGQRFSYVIPEHRRFLGSKVSVYYEISTCDMYVRQKILNKKIPLRDIITLGVGIIFTI